MTHTDKQPQNVYIIPQNDKPWKMQKIPNVYLITPEELEALIRERERKAAERALMFGPVKSILQIGEYLNEHYPLPPKK